MTTRTIYMDDIDFKELTDFSKKHDRAYSWIIRKAVKEFIKNHSKIRKGL